MLIITMIVIGGLAGWIAALVSPRKNNVLMDVILGIIGAIAGSFLMLLLGRPQITGMNVYALIVGTVWAIGFVVIGRILSHC